MIFRSIIFLVSLPFALIYFFIVLFRNIFYDVNIIRKYRINAKVISVGNITWGGTGKTPVAAFIADLLARRNHKVSILIRGYGNDESELLPKLTSNIPVFVGKDRVKKAIDVVEKHLADTIILDDGFQYRRLIRDIDIVCIDAVNPFGRGWVIPSGSMREGIASLRRADIFLITKVDLVSSKDKLGHIIDKLASINPKATIARAIHRPLYFYRHSDGEKVNIDRLKNKEIVLVSAIGSPVCFGKTIQRLGLRIDKHFIFRDHHSYTKDDITLIEGYCRKHKCGTIVTTEKDAVKLGRNDKGRPDLDFEYLVLKVRLEIIENENGFYNRLLGIYSNQVS